MIRNHVGPLAQNCTLLNSFTTDAPGACNLKSMEVDKRLARK